VKARLASACIGLFPDGNWLANAVFGVALMTAVITRMKSCRCGGGRCDFSTFVWSIIIAARDAVEASFALTFPGTMFNGRDMVQGSEASSTHEILANVPGCREWAAAVAIGIWVELGAVLCVDLSVAFIAALAVDFVGVWAFESKVLESPSGTCITALLDTLNCNWHVRRCLPRVCVRIAADVGICLLSHTNAVCSVTTMRAVITRMSGGSAGSHVKVWHRTNHPPLIVVHVVRLPGDVLRDNHALNIIVEPARITGKLASLDRNEIKTTFGCEVSDVEEQPRWVWLQRAALVCIIVKWIVPTGRTTRASVIAAVP